MIGNWHPTAGPSSLAFLEFFDLSPLKPQLGASDSLSESKSRRRSAEIGCVSAPKEPQACRHRAMFTPIKSAISSPSCPCSPRHRRGRNAGTVQENGRERRDPLLRLWTGFCHVLGSAIAHRAPCGHTRDSGNPATPPPRSFRPRSASEGELSGPGVERRRRFLRYGGSRYGARLGPVAFELGRTVSGESGPPVRQ